MKKTLLTVCAFALVFFGCSKKETAVPKEEELYPVTFNVNTFSKVIVPMASLKAAGHVNASTITGNAISDAIGFITYAVYSESGIKLNEKKQNNFDLDFGIIEDALPKGTYTVLVFGNRFWSPSAPTMYTYDYAYHANTDRGGDDTYFKQLTLVISDKIVEQSIELRRKVGKVEFDLTDNIPENIEEIAYSITGVSSYFVPKSNQGYNTSTVSKSNFYYSADQSDYSQNFDLYFLLDGDFETTASVNIRAYDRNRNLVANKIITDVPVAINKKTILTGRLFDEAGSGTGQSFSISIDDKWSSDINYVEF